MKLIKKLKIGYKDYDVYELDPVHANELEISGDCLHAENRIRVLMANNDWETLNTLVHESFHGIWHVYGMQDGDNEERIVNTMANGFINIIRDNPELVRTIIEISEGQLNADKKEGRKS